MNAPREALEEAVRRNLAFHLGKDSDELVEERELLVSAMLDAAEERLLHEAVDVQRELDDYLPNSCNGLSPPAREEMCDDILRDAHRYFPPKHAKGDGEEGGEGEDADPGCCLLCERFMPLTRHHVMPRSTHKRYRKKGYADATLNRTIDICRPCHSAVHRAHDALTLAEQFTTREQLLQDEAIGRFVAWVRKQRTTTKEDANNNLLHYRR